MHIGIDLLEDAKPSWHTDGRRREQRILPLPLGRVSDPRLPLQVLREALCLYEPAVGKLHMSVSLAAARGPGAVGEGLLQGRLVMLVL